MSSPQTDSWRERAPRKTPTVLGASEAVAATSGSSRRSSSRCTEVPDVLSGLIVHPISAAADVLRQYRQFCAAAPDEVTVWVVMRKAPPLPFLPPEVHGTEVLVLAALYAGPMADGEKASAPGTADRRRDQLRTTSPDSRWRSTAADTGCTQLLEVTRLPALDDGLLDTLLEYVGTLPDRQCEIFIAQMGGATSRVPTWYGLSTARRRPTSSSTCTAGGTTPSTTAGASSGVAACSRRRAPRGRGVRQLHDRGGDRPRAGRVRRQSAHGGAETEDDEPVPPQPEHPARRGGVAVEGSRGRGNAARSRDPLPPRSLDRYAAASGRMFWLRRNRLVGSYFRFSSTMRW